MLRFSRMICPSDFYTDYTVCPSTPYILEALWINVFTALYTDYTDFRIKTHTLYIRIKKSQNDMRARAYEIKMTPYNPYNPYNACLKAL